MNQPLVKPEQSDTPCPTDWDDNHRCPHSPKPEQIHGGFLIVYAKDVPHNCEECNRDYADKNANNATK